MRRLLAVAMLFAAFVVPLAFAASAAAQVPGEIRILHTPPTEALPGRQIYLTATLVNATEASIAWRNDTMASDAILPMTNLSRFDGTGWVYAAYLPAQDRPTQITYTITASNGASQAEASFFLTVDYPPDLGITPEEQVQWALSVAASVSMAASVVAMMYWYVSRRLQRGVT